MRIIDLSPNDQRTIQQIAEMLVEGFREDHPEAWPTIEDALKEVGESFDEERISRVAFDDDSVAVGWVGGISQYDGDVWELHPLVVRMDRQGSGVAGLSLPTSKSRSDSAAGRSSGWAPTTRTTRLRWLESSYSPG
jgi:hypothetical protein